MKKERQPESRLLEERMKRHWTQLELADRIGTTAINVSRWERRITAPGPYFRHQLCEIFEQSATELGLVPREAEIIEPLFNNAETTSSELPLPSAFLPPFSPWYVPHRRNPFFTGREEVLEQLHTVLFAKQSTSTLQAWMISGLGGIGKTQTVIEYAYRFRNDYHAVLWAQAETRSTLVANATPLASELHLPVQNQIDQPQIFEKVLEWLKHHSHWLLILDNVEDFSLLEEFLSGHTQGHLLVTTRRQSAGTFAFTRYLEQLTPEEGTLLLLRRAKRINPYSGFVDTSSEEYEIAQKISTVLGQLPLALDQAAAYIEETGCNLSDYLSRYEERRAYLLNRRGAIVGTTEHPQSVSATLALAIEHIQRIDQSAATLLHLCAFLHPDAIPEEMFLVEDFSLDPSLDHLPIDAFALDIAVASLRMSSLIQRNSELKLLTIHQIVQAVIKDRLNNDEQRHWAKQVVLLLNRSFPENDFTQWTRCQRYISQALTCTQLIEQWDLAIPEAANLLDRAASYLVESGQYQLAEHPFQQALALCSKLFGEHHPKVAESLNNLAVLYHSQGRLPEALPLYQRALAIREKQLGPEHSDIAESLNNLAFFYWQQKEYTLAEPLYLRAVRIREREQGPDHPDLALNLANLAWVYLEQDRYAEAEPLFKRALTIRQHVLGDNHPQTAMSLNSLAVLYSRQGAYAQAEALFQQAQVLLENGVGLEHERTAQNLHDYAQLYTLQQRYEEAIPLYQRALKIREALLPANHPAISETLECYASILQTMQRSTEANHLLERARIIQQKQQE